MLTLFVLLALQAPVARSDTTGHADVPVVAARRATRAPRLDGRLDEPEWAAAPVASAFWQLNPAQGQPASERTEVRVLFDDDALYVAARMFETDPRQIRSLLMRRDAVAPVDRFALVLDGGHDHQSAARFAVNPRGVRSDELLANDAADGDVSWDPVWQAAVSTDSAGWTAELRIPLSQLRFRGGEPGVWGVNFERYLASRQEHDSFVPMMRTQRGYVSRFGHLVGLDAVSPRRELELMPYVSGQVETHRGAGDDPFTRRTATRERAGLDLRSSVGSNVRLAATINPDFGQVEADPATLNLSAFETFFTERRPFFLDGQPVFVFPGAGEPGAAGGAQFFYSRRIGGAPALSPDVAAAFAGTADSLRSPFVQRPTSTAVLGAAKLTGSLPHGVSVGLLHAETGREYAAVALGNTGVSTGGSTDAGRRVRELVEPRGHYSVGRIRQDLRDGMTSIGVMATGVTRGLETPRLDSAFAARAYAAGVDWRHRWDGGRFQFDGWVGGSYVGGTAATIARAQRSPVRYLQRPDRAGGFDSTRTALVGTAGESRIAYDAPSGLSMSVAGRATAPGFELNDIGYLTAADERSVVATVGWQQPRPSARVQSYGASVYDAEAWMWDGTRLGRTVGLVAFGYAQAGWGGTATLERSVRGLSRTAARGGPLLLTGARTAVSYSVLTDPRRALGLVAYGRHAAGEFGDRQTELGASFTLRPSPSVQLALGPSLGVSREAASYVADVPDTLAVATYGRRYVFATLDQKSIGVAARAEVAFAPDVSLQLYAQPYSAAARYTGLRELRRARSFDFRPYAASAGASVVRDGGTYAIDPDVQGPAEPFTIGDPDVVFRSLNGTAVLRWEYRPGATVYGVWTQRRTGDATVAGFRVRDVSDVLRAAPENVFLLKVSAWWSR
jgi:hypothetical protein